MTHDSKIRAVWAFVLAGMAGTAAAADLTSLAAGSKPAVVFLKVHDASGREAATGSGFFISASGRLVTNDHVVAGANRVVAKLLDGREIEVLGILAKNEARDLAILQAAGGDYEYLILSKEGRASVGSPVAVIGSPMGLSWTVSPGIVSAIREDGMPAKLREKGGNRSGALMQITAPISPGSSGSPVLNEAGQVIGVAASVVTGGAASGGALNFAIPVAALRELIRTIDVEQELETFGTVPIRNLIISLVFFTLVGGGLVGWKKRGQAKKKSGGRSNLN